MTLEAFNHLPATEARDRLLACCAAEAWANAMTNARPFASREAMHEQARQLWPQLSETEWLAAFDAHPRIGDIESLKAKYAGTEALASGEQSGAATAPETVLRRLAAGNEAYLEKFGFIFIVCATGKTAEQMLALLEERLPNSRERELTVAAEEQAKITHLRLDKLI